MEKLVFDYTHFYEPEFYDWNLPFEYESKERFIFDVLENPLILNDIGFSVYHAQIETKSVFKEDYIMNLDHYVLTLEEWFEKNKQSVTSLKK